MKRCDIRCECLCHDTGGSGHDHEGAPCPGKRATRQKRIEEAAREAASWDCPSHTGGFDDCHFCNKLHDDLDALRAALALPRDEPAKASEAAAVAPRRPRVGEVWERGSLGPCLVIADGDPICRWDDGSEGQMHWPDLTDWRLVATPRPATDSLDAALASERERCARECEVYGREGDRQAKEYAAETADELAARIRALGPPSTHDTRLPADPVADEAIRASALLDVGEAAFVEGYRAAHADDDEDFGEAYDIKMRDGSAWGPEARAALRTQTLPPIVSSVLGRKEGGR